MSRGLPSPMGGIVFSWVVDFGDQLIGEGIHGQEVNDTAWKDAIWGDF